MSAPERRALRRAGKGGASLVVAVGHIPAETDSTRKARGDIARLARGIKGVDGWFGGHSHNVVDDVIENAPVMIAGANGQWLAIADYTVDPVKRAALLRAAESRALASSPYLPVYHYASHELIKPYVKGLFHTALDVHPLSRVWIDRDWRQHEPIASGARRWSEVRVVLVRMVTSLRLRRRSAPPRRAPRR